MTEPAYDPRALLAAIALVAAIRSGVEVDLAELLDGLDPLLVVAGLAALTTRLMEQHPAGPDLALHEVALWGAHQVAAS